MKLNKRDLAMMVDHAHKRLVQMPTNARTLGDRPLSEGERLAACYMEAALTVLGSKGLKVSDITIDWDDSVVEPT